MLLTGEGEELWRRQLPLPLATMGWSPFDGIAALGLYLEHDDGGLTFVNAGGNDIATQDVHGWPRGITFSQDLVLLACDDGIYAFNSRGEMLSHRLVDELESFCASQDGRIMLTGAGYTLRCWER